MSLRKKTLLIISITLICLISILYTTTRIILLGSFASLEKQQTERNVERFLNILANELAALDAKTYDWACWDDTYAFIEHPNQAYIKSNLVDETFTGTNMNLMLFIHSSGRLVAGKAFDVQNKKEIPIPQSIMNQFVGNRDFLQFTNTQGKMVGIILFPEGLCFCALDLS